MSVALVNGASGGIGSQFVRHLLRDTSMPVVATSRKGQSAQAALLKDGLEQYKDRLTCLEVDVEREDSLAEASKAYESKHGKGSLRLMLNVPGILEAEKSLSHVSLERMERIFRINTFGHLLSYKYFTPMLPSKKQLFDGSQKDPAAPYVPSDLSVLASLSARVGSIGENERGGWYSYRASKAALNQMIKTLNIEMSMRSTAPTIALALHPGTTGVTGISEGFVKESDINQKRGIHDPATAAKHLLDTISKQTRQTGGSFLAWDGDQIPW